MGEEVKTSIVLKLAGDGANWVTYRDRMTLTFKRRGLGDHLDFTKPTKRYTALATVSSLTVDEKWEEDEFAFRELIAISIPDNEFNRIKSATHGKDMWDQLKGMYESWTQALLSNMWRQLQNTKCKEDVDLQVHFNNMQVL